jgi:hypothetical protein
MLIAKPTNLKMHIAYVDEHISQRFWNFTKRKAPRCVLQQGPDRLHAYVDEHISQKNQLARKVLCGRILQDACLGKVPDLLQFKTSGSAIPNQSGEAKVAIERYSRKCQAVLQCSFLCVVYEPHSHVLLVRTHVSSTKVCKQRFRSLGAGIDKDRCQ